MTNTSIAQPAFARRYASAFVDLLDKKQVLPAREESLLFLNLVNESSDLQALIKNPLFSTDDKIAVLRTVAEKAGLSAELFRLVETLADNGRVAQLPQVLNAVIREISDRLGEIFARVESAFELNKTQMTKLEKEISNITGGKANMEVLVNPNLIGGVVITIGSQRFDGSVKRRLELLEQELRAGANENAKELKSA